MILNLLVAVTLPVVPTVRSARITDAKLPPEGYRIRIDAGTHPRHPSVEPGCVGSDPEKRAQKGSFVFLDATLPGLILLLH